MPKPLYVKFRRPFFGPEGKFYPAGIQELPGNFDKKKLPSSAVVIKEEVLDDERKKEDGATLPDGAKPLAQDTGKTLSEIGGKL